MAETSPRKPRVRAPAAAREALVVAAEQIFNRDGYFATNSNAIAREAGYAPATFYTHFEDKLGLFVTVYERWVLEEWKEIRSRPLTGGRRTILTGIVDAVIARHVRTAVFRRSLRALDLLEPDVRARRNIHRSQQLDWMAELGASLEAAHTSIENRTLALLMIERLADAIADRELDALDLDIDSVLASLVSTIETLLFGAETREA